LGNKRNHLSKYIEEPLKQNDDRQADVCVERNVLLASREEEVEASSVARLIQERRLAAIEKEEQEEKSPKRSTRIESMMERYRHENKTSCG
jgi:hypothetical protein